MGWFFQGENPEANPATPACVLSFLEARLADLLPADVHVFQFCNKIWMPDLGSFPLRILFDVLFLGVRGL